MPRQSKDTVAVLGIDIGKNTFHLVGLNKRGGIILRLKLSRTRLEAKLANLPRRHGSLCRRPSPEPPAQNAGARSEADAGQVRQGVPQGQQERFPRC